MFSDYKMRRLVTNETTNESQMTSIDVTNETTNDVGPIVTWPDKAIEKKCDYPGRYKLKATFDILCICHTYTFVHRHAFLHRFHPKLTGYNKGKALLNWEKPKEWVEQDSEEALL